MTRRLRDQARRSVAAALLAIAIAPSARADLTPAEVDARYASIDLALEQGESRARLWWYGWTLGFTAIVVGESVAAGVTHDQGTRASSIVSAAGSALGVGAMLLTASRAPFEARGRLAAMKASTPEERLARLREAEKLLDRAADDEIGGQSIFAHLATDIVTLAGTYVLWAGYHTYGNGWLNLVGGTLVGEAQILTRPTAAIAARRAYRAGVLTLPTGSTFSWTLLPTAGGMTLAGSF